MGGNTFICHFSMFDAKGELQSPPWVRSSMRAFNCTFEEFEIATASGYYIMVHLIYPPSSELEKIFRLPIYEYFEVSSMTFCPQNKYSFEN